MNKVIEICKKYQNQLNLTPNEFAFELGADDLPNALGWAGGWLSGLDIPDEEDLIALTIEYKDWRYKLAVELKRLLY